uniref:Histone-lysine N-methyltransferase 2C n=1 Tax=Scleropages formosus TaxID=113540 RepID=A0A8C9VI72_SCLFO
PLIAREITNTSVFIYTKSIGYLWLRLPRVFQCPRSGARIFLFSFFFPPFYFFLSLFCPQHCAYCKRLGATVKCCEETCHRSYHYPCAAAAGTFQDIRSHVLLCPSHIQQAVNRSAEQASCAVCDSPGDLLDQLFCTSCGQHYHGLCLDIAPMPLKRAGWQCPECKVCQTCKNPGEDSKMLVCDMCDKGYHTFCLQPVMDSIPTNGWRCKNCRVCVQCGTRTSSQWHHNSLLCDGCYQQQDPVTGCYLCGNAINPEIHKDLLSCHLCKRWLHLECEQPADGDAEAQSREEHVCAECKQTELETVQAVAGEALEVPRPVAEPAPGRSTLQLLFEYFISVYSMFCALPAASPVPEVQAVQNIQEVQEVNVIEVPKLPLSPSVDVEEPAVELTPPVEAEKADRELQITEAAEPAKAEVLNTEVESELPSEKVQPGPMTEAPKDKPTLDFSSPTEDRVPKTSPAGPLESPPKQAGSPFSGRTSPRELTPNQIPTAAQEHGSSVPSSTFISMTPKIGMGKPAISKRKFSPGRPKAKQVGSRSHPFSTFFRGVLLPRKNSQECVSPQGRGSGFPGKRRPRGSGLSGRGGRGRSKLKNAVSPVVTPGVSLVETQYTVKEEEENAMHNTVVMFSSSDTFTLKQDMCVVCGSFGLGAEGRLLACAQCGQCYHPFCVNIKITKVVLSKGWRCLECTVCEACGQASDPGRLLLCDDCDISYHTYCLDPPLQTVPKGSWKCRWCVTCTQCGATSPGLRCEWQNNYTQCAPCGSLAVCPLCARTYCEDELIMQCRQCDRWMHASCVGLNSEEQVETAADSGFDCTMCRAHMTPSQATPMTMCTEVVELPAVPQIMMKIKELGRTYTQDGVCLTESGLSQLQSLAARGGRRRRPKPKLKLKIINQNSVAVLQAPPDPQSEHSRDGDADESRAEGDPVDCEGKSDSSPERELVDEDPKGLEGPDGTKKRKRKPYRPGIGGFMVRQRSRTGQGKAKRLLSRKDSSGSVSENMLGKDEAWTEMPETPIEETAPECLEKVKKRYRKKRTKLEEEFPSYLQEAFFGKELLDKSRQNRPALESGLSDDDRALADGKIAEASFHKPTSDPLPSAAAKMQGTPSTSNSEDPLLDLSEVLNTDGDILGMLSGDLEKSSEGSGRPATSSLSKFSSRTLPEEPLDGILSPELDKMVTDGAILGKLYKIPELEGKDVEDLFTAVLSPSASQPPPLTPPTPHSTRTMANPVFPRMPMMNGLVGQNPNFPPMTMTPSRSPCGPSTVSPIHRMPFADNMRDKKFGQVQRDQMGLWIGPGPNPLPEGEMDTMSNAQRNTLKWEKEETLGEAATVAPVLYTNVNFPNLKEEFPDWSTRVKQIAKLWRKASSQERAPYVQKARDNRAALRINKVHMSNESLKRQQHHQQQPPVEMFDPGIPLDTELLFKDPLKHKESEHEQEWKFRQQMRQKSKQQAKIEATQKLEQVKSEQQQLQQQQQQLGRQSEGNTSSSDNQSPLTPQPANGNMSPMQQSLPKDGFPRPQLPGTPTSGSSDDVFLRPPPPPPAGPRVPIQDGTVCPLQGPSSQPQSPQRFSPSSTSSRPSSPWDPYAKMVGTPRPPPLGSNTPRRNSIEAGKSPRSEQVERGRPSPVHESFGSPTSLNDPYTKPPDTPRPAVAADPFVKPMGPPRANPVTEQQGRHLIGPSGGNTFARPAHRAELYQRMPPNRMILSDPYSRPLLTPIPGSNESGSVPLFKTPMPPHQSQDTYGSTHSNLRPQHSDGFSQNQLVDPYAQPPLTPRPSINENFSHPSRIVRHPQDYSQSMHDPYAQPPGTPRPSSDPYAQPPGTPRPSSDPYAQPPGTPRPSSDPYTQPPGTPRPISDSYVQHPTTPQPSPDPYAQPPNTPRPSPDPYSQPPGTPRPTTDPYPVQRPLSNQDPFSPPQGRLTESFTRPGAPGPQTPKNTGFSDDGFAPPQPNQPNQTPVHDPFDQATVTPHSQPNDRFPHELKEQQGVGHEVNSQDLGQFPDIPPTSGTALEAQSGVHPVLDDTEEKLKQRQRIRELIRKQQQQKCALRQEKGLQEPAVTTMPGTPRHWSQESSSQQNDVFGRPPPPYPGNVKGSLRFPGPFPSEQPQFPGDMNTMSMRPQGQRFGFSTGGQPPPGSQEHFLKPHQMPEPAMNVPPQMRRSMSVDLARAMGNNQMGHPQHFPPRGIQVQQHNIMGQPFIELRHRAPENRMRLPFGPSPMTGNVVDPSTQTQGPLGFMSGQEVGFSVNQGNRMVDHMVNQRAGMPSHTSVSSSMENLHQHSVPGCTGPHPPLMRSLSHPASTEAINITPSILLPAATEQTVDIPIPNPDGIEEKLDTDDSAVKDLEDVEVKDLVDEDLENLNLDPEDGKDLDLETNDLHLDDFLTSGKFDIIAYTDPELDLEDKKDMFNEELDLSDPIDDSGEASDLQKELSEKKSISSGSVALRCQANTEPGVGKPEDMPEHGLAHVKQERSSDQSVHTLCSETLIKTELTEVAGGSSATTDQVSAGTAHPQEDLGSCSRLMEVPLHQPPQPSPSGLSNSAPVLSRLLGKEKLVDAALGPISSPSKGDLTVQASQVAGIQQGPSVMTPGQIPKQAMNPALNMSHLISPTEGLPPESLNVEQEQPPGHGFGADQQLEPVLSLQNQQLPSNLTQTQQAVFSQGLGQQNQQNRPLLLEEQPLLLQDLLDQERQEQQQQRQMQAMIRQRSSESFFPNIDFDGITDPIMKAKMVALKGINKVMVQNNLGMAPIKKQYEEWLQETQQLLQIQQKFLEEQIGAHRKSKKALSAKQRTAKKAGRQFPEEDAEQLKHVTEQQGVVQKQLEQIRKQQKEHAELIEEYHVKHKQQCAMQPPMVMVPGCPPMMQGQLQSSLPPNAPRMPTVPGWHPVNPAPMVGPRMSTLLPHQGPAANSVQQPPPLSEAAGNAANGDSPHVKFDDNNPFSEGFQERERKERLREQQERQRVQLMQEVGRQRALQQRMELEHQGGPHGFVPPTGPQQPLRHMFPQQPNMQAGFMGSPPVGHFPQGGEHRPVMGNGPFGPDMRPGFRPNNPVMPGSNFPQGQPRPPRFGTPGLMPQGTGEVSPFRMEPAMSLPPNYPGSGPSLIQLYSNIIPEEKGKKKRNRKKKKEEDSESVRTPSTPHSDLTAPLTPAVSDTASTPTRGTQPSGEPDPSEHSVGSITPGSLSRQTPSELEHRLPDTGGGSSENTVSGTSEVTPKNEQNMAFPTIKLERVDISECHGAADSKTEPATGPGIVKVEEGRERAGAHTAGLSPAPSSKGESGNELLKHLLKNKSAPPLLPHQMSSDGSTQGERQSEDSKAMHKHSSADSTEVRDTSHKVQDNLSNPPTPPASLPPTPPPLARQKMVNGFATTEELAAKAVVIVAKGLGPKPFPAPFRPEEELLARAIAQGPKTVDVPASLPTPPHNNHEELRGQEPCEDRDTPDSFIPSSSPESVVGMEISRYPDLSRVKEEQPSPAPSPIIPMLPSTSGKGTRSTKQQDVKMEASGMFFGSQTEPASNDSKAGLVSIAITLNPAAAENITSVVAAVADLLCVKIPSSYEVSGGPEWGPLALLGGLKVPPHRLDPRGPGLPLGPGSRFPGSTRFQNPPGASGAPHQHNGSPGPKPQWCCHCKVVILGNGVRKPIKDLPSLKQDTAVFCSHSCFVLYSSARQPEAAAVLPDSALKENPSKVLHQYSNNMSTLDVHCLPHLPPKSSPPSTPPLAFPSASLDAEAKPDALKVTVKLKPRPRAVHSGADDPHHHSKRWKGLRWRKWSVNIMLPGANPQLPAEDEVDELLQKLGASLRPEPLPRDHRRCCFCHEEGDGLTDGPARLLNLDLDLWVHLNCALWSTEVYETQAGALINVELALRRGLSVRCAYCQRTGATSGCHRFRCANVYHFTCALKAQCTFFKDKTMLCHAHRPRGASSQEHELHYFAVFRRVYVQRDEVRQLASVVRRGERDHTFRVGSLVLHSVGQLLPQQMAAFHSTTAIFPVGYEASRIYWSTRHSNRRCRYLCSIDEKEGRPEFRVRIVEQGYEDLILTDNTPKGVWDKVLAPVAERRSESGMLKLFPIYLKGEDLFGLTVSAVTRITESLPSVEACENYTFRYGRNPLMHLPLAMNPSGCARSEPRSCPLVPRFVLRPHTLTSSRTSKCYQGAVSSEPGTPYTKHFVHSKSSQYRRMKAEWKSSVFLARSRIQGLGLYAARDIEKYTMVIEYVGTVLRNAVANRKEKIYESQNRGVYMFRIDSEHVIDATLRGGPARYINHSCAPNCVAEVVTFERGHKIIISSIRKIQKGEELCYDYKFDLEDDQHKVPCHCGAVNCRKWLN